MVWIFVALGIIAFSLLGVAILSKSNRVRAPSKLSAFQLHEGHPWMMLSVGDAEVMAVADTGSTQPYLGPNLVNQVESRLVGEKAIETPFGTRQVLEVQVKSLGFGGREFQWLTVLVEKSSLHQEVPIIGASLLFSSDNTLFTRDGFDFDVDESSMPAGTCVPVLIDLTGNTLGHPVAAVYFRMRINGSDKKVFFDTGFPDVLAGTPKSTASGDRAGWPRPSLLKDPASGRLQFSWAYPSNAVIELGDDSINVKYLRQSRFNYIDAEFVMGAGILREYSILITPRRGRACFFKNQES